MLYDLEWLKPGRQFPPPSEGLRLERYSQNKRIFDNRHGEVYTEQFRRIQKVIGDYVDIKSHPIILNFQKKISLKTADMLFQEPPQYTAEDEGKNKVIQEVVNNSDLNGIGFQGAIDASRYGDGVFKIKKEANKGKICLSSPRYLFTVVDENDRKKVKYQVLAWVYKITDALDKKHEYLKVSIHEVGYYEDRKYTYENNCIGQLIESTGRIKTGLDVNAIIPVHNLLTSDSVYGIDDYVDVDSIVSELEVRTAQVSKILDVHAKPTMSGSTSALKLNEDGSYSFEAGNYYKRGSSDEPPLEYITWEANLEANFTQIDKLMKDLSIISEMGIAIMNEQTKLGNMPSGTALRKLYINVLAKVARLRNSFDRSFKMAIAAASEIGYSQKVKADEVVIVWQDGLPNDAKEEAEIMQMRTANKPTMSIKRGLMQYDGMTEDAADTEIEVIADEEMELNAMQTPDISKTVIEEDEE